MKHVRVITSNGGFDYVREDMLRYYISTGYVKSLAS